MIAQRNTAYAEESAEVEVLYANLEKLKNLTKKIQASMSRLEENGRTVKDAIGPIYSNTQTLQITNRNVDRINEAIDRIRQPLDAKAQEQRIIQAGPDTIGLDEYLQSMQRVQRALSDLTQTNLRSNQQAVTEFTGLLDYGSRQLQEILRSTLAEDVQPVEPLHYITKRTHYRLPDLGPFALIQQLELPFPTFDREKISLLQSLCSAITGSVGQTENPAVTIYSEIRAPYLKASLENLATASINTSKRTSPDTIYRQGTSGIGAYTSSIEGIILAENANINSIFSQQDQGSVLDLTCKPALSEFSKTLRELHSQIKSNITTDCFLAYEIIDVVSTLSSHLDVKTGELKAPLFEALKPIRETAKSSLSELLDDTRKKIQSLTLLPADSAALPITTETLTRLQALTLYQHSLSSILASLGDGNWKTPSSTSTTPLDVGVDGSILLAHYVMDTIDTLLSSLETKARTLLKGKHAIGVFLANNVAIIERSIRSSDLAALLPSANPVLDNWKKKALHLYLDAWKDPSSHLLDVQYTNRGARPPSGGSGGVIDSGAVIKALSSKDKDNIKEKFKGFNTAFDDLLQKHKGLTMEKEVKGMFAREVQSLIEPLYARFWDRYHEIDKGRGKYVKFDKGSLAAQLAALG